MCPKYVHKGVQNDSVKAKTTCHMGLLAQPHILPVVSLWLGFGKNRVEVNCVLDTASQRTYLNSRAIQDLEYDPELLSEAHYDVQSFGGVVLDLSNKFM